MPSDLDSLSHSEMLERTGESIRRVIKRNQVGDLNPFESWLIRQRKYCERCSDLTHATTVRRFNGKDLILCAEHAKRLDAVRQSERKQEKIPQ